MKEEVFFAPRKGERYETGFKGVRTLVVGVCHICTLQCPHHGRCSDPEGVRDMDTQCPCYADQEDQEYYRLGNSNEIEIDSFVNGDAQYPGYKIFTYYMLKKAGDLTVKQRKGLWEQLAFTNLLQFFHDSSDELPKEQTVYENAFPALMQVVEELRPQLIIAWDSRVKECLKKHGDSLRYTGKCDMGFGLELYLFTPCPAALTGRQLSKVRYAYGVKPEKHNLKWYKQLVRKHLKNCVAEKSRLSDIVGELSEILQEFVASGYLGTDENSLYFPNDDNCEWTSLEKGLFLSALKDQFPDLKQQGTNPAIEAMFQESLATNKRDASLLKGKESFVVSKIKKSFSKSQGPGKTFSK